MRLDPIKTTEKIKQDYVRYLKTTFPIRNNDLAAQFEKLLREENRFFNGPILEATPPFKSSASISDLMHEGILHKGFKDLCNEELPINRSLYKHQELAIKKIVKENRNIVVATGTGSGKTEAFLIPIFHHLLVELENGELTPGVRALLLYPMNALANDQMKRLRKMLLDFPQITFGRYTGETKETSKAAKEHFLKNFPDEQYIPNELHSREEMRDKPPHILLTNYAMLEYLLLRPKDHEFFDGEKAKYWRFMVIDEAHTYDGAKGIEMAMLIRRLKDRIVKSNPGRIRCIATSATLGNGQEDFPRVANFASQLFNERFEWENNNTNKQDVIQAIRMEFDELGQEWGKPNPNVYKSLRNELKLQDISLEKLYHICKQYEIPQKQLDKAMQVSKEKSENESIQRFLYEVLKGDSNFRFLRKSLISVAKPISEISKLIFPEYSSVKAQQFLNTLVDISVRAKKDRVGTSLFPARYHLFVRALEGAYLQIFPRKVLYLDRKKSVKTNGKVFPVFEIASCRRCGNIYFVGETSGGKLQQIGKVSESNRKEIEFYALWMPELSVKKEDEDESVLVGSEEFLSTGELYELCPQCGEIDKEGLVTPLCSCTGEKIKVKKVISEEYKVRYCSFCGSRSSTGNLVWRFLTGQDAPITVLTTSLYQQLPSRKLRLSTQTKNRDNRWGSISIQKINKESEMNGRQLLLFSDSRQDAAFFASYLDRTYHHILRRRIIVQTLRDYSEDIIRNQWRIQDLIDPCCMETEQLGVFPKKWGLQQRKNEVWKWVLRELLTFERQYCLEGFGLLGFSVVKPKNWTIPSNHPLSKSPWSLNDEEIWCLYKVLLDSFRIGGAITFPNAISPKDEVFKPRNYEYYFRERVSASTRHIYAWGNPSKGRLNRRLDYLIKLSKDCSSDISEEDCNRLLLEIWKKGLNIGDNNSIWSDYFHGESLSEEGTVYRIRYEYWKLEPGYIDPSIEWFQCDTCKKIYLQNLRGICPTYQCNGRLATRDPNEVFKGNHYRELYLRLRPLNMVAKEHTAQLTGEAAANVQDQFVNGEVNVLSCSTTFELGVDVGELESVLMRNVPPSPANYIQRAGRAGRRTDSTAFALTFCQRRSHDLTHFIEPERMVSGKVRSPYFEITNEKIVRRHIQAVALANFWKEYPEYFGRTGTFFFPPQNSVPEKYKKYLESQPELLKQALNRIVPHNLRPVIDIDRWLWVEKLLGADGILTKVSQEIRSDVEELEKIHNDLSKSQKPSDHVLRSIKTIKERDIIGYLSSKNVLPKYGFPVDVVGLQIMHHGEDAKQLDLQRDLRIAISEYAPESEIVAGGRLWVSRGLKKIPKREWIKYKYAICPGCGRYQKELEEKSESMIECCACGEPLTGRGVKGKFLIPEFGFVTDNKAPKTPGDNRPIRTYSTRAYFSGDFTQEERMEELVFDSISIKAISYREGQMAVLNRAGFKICHRCGFGIRSDSKAPSPHYSAWGRKCNGTLQYTELGHEFRTDIVDLRINGYNNISNSFRFSVLYGLLEGLSDALEISRDDIDGCIFNDKHGYAFILYDNVPGGAGHVKRITENHINLKLVLKSAKNKVSGKCGCGIDTSCYSCLRSYQNQFCHDQLKRGEVLDFLNLLPL